LMHSSNFCNLSNVTIGAECRRPFWGTARNGSCAVSTELGRRHLVAFP
jgi:hypothetical protein